MISFKQGVELNGVRPEIVAAMIVVGLVAGRDIVITSVTEGKHSRGSLHYIGHAFDIRIRDIKNPEDIDSLVMTIREHLTDEFDVVLEATHIHVEFQPKG